LISTKVSIFRRASSSESSRISRHPASHRTTTDDLALITSLTRLKHHRKIRHSRRADRAAPQHRAPDRRSAKRRRSGNWIILFFAGNQRRVHISDAHYSIGGPLASFVRIILFSLTKKILLPVTPGELGFAYKVYCWLPTRVYVK